MATKTYGKKKTTAHSLGFGKQLLLVFVAFLTGYLSASVFDAASLTSWVQAHWNSDRNKPLSKLAQSTEPKALPKPKFEFYTLLTNEHAPEEATAKVPAVSAEPAAMAATPAQKPIPTTPVVTEGKIAASPQVAKTSAYWVQVASFQRKQDAERLKASLALQGFSGSITAVTQQQSQWYRVLIGPFVSQEEAKTAQRSVAQREHLAGMIRKTS